MCCFLLTVFKFAFQWSWQKIAICLYLIYYIIYIAFKTFISKNWGYSGFRLNFYNGDRVNSLHNNSHYIKLLSIVYRTTL